MKNKKTGTLVGLVCAMVLAGFFLVFRASPVEAVYPFERIVAAVRTKVFSRIRGCFRGAAAQAENRRLRREVEMLALVRTDLERLETENARLRRALSYRARDPEAWLAAGVLSCEGGAASVRATMRVDKGALAGVNVGAVVAVAEGLVGVVSSTTPHTAEVLLICDPMVKVACEIESTDGPRLRGVLCGGTEELLSLRYLTGDATVPPRSRVLTSGLGGVFPKGLEVGTYLGGGEVLPSVDFSMLEDVFIRRAK